MRSCSGRAATRAAAKARGSPRSKPRPTRALVYEAPWHSTAGRRSAPPRECYAAKACRSVNTYDEARSCVATAGAYAPTEKGPRRRVLIRYDDKAGSALRELEAAAGLRLAVLLALDHAA